MTLQRVRKRLHRHGGSKALDLPVSFIKNLSSDYVKITIHEGSLIIEPDSDLDRVEEDPLFEKFIALLYQDALENPSRLKDIKDVWGKDWDDLLEGVTDDDE